MPKKEKAKIKDTTCTTKPGRSSVGKIAVELQQKAKDPVSVIDQTNECLSEYEKELLKCADLGKKSYKGSFFITVITKKERLMENVLRNWFIHRLSCPTPDYDQTLYRYDKQRDDLEFIWTIPSKDACLYLKSNAMEVTESERALLKFVLDFADGTLFKRAQKLNNESDFAPNLAIIRTDTH